MKPSLKDQIISDFDRIEQIDWNLFYREIRDASTSYPVKESKKRENRDLNRYRDVCPFDHSRIILERGTVDYINASLLEPIGGTNRKYILTQGPLFHTVSHFWSMVFEQKSRIIVMLNLLIEWNSIKCHQYWPDEVGQDFIFDEVKLRVELTDVIEKAHYTVRTFTLFDMDSGDTLDVTQYHYTAWPDFGIPQSPDYFLEFLYAVRSSNQLDMGPAVVHCSAGIGRSGTFCLVDTCLLMIEQQKEDTIDIRSLLLQMRKYRMGLIQTPEQLKFCYMAIIHGADHLKVDVVHQRIPVNGDLDDLVPENVLKHRISIPQHKPFPSPGDLMNGSLPSPPSDSSVSSTDSDPVIIPSPKVPSTPTVNPLPVGSLNNNLSPTELREQAREERKRRMEDKIKDIKEKQKKVEDHRKMKGHLIKWGVVGLAVILGAGLIYRLWTGYSSTTKPEDVLTSTLNSLPVSSVLPPAPSTSNAVPSSSSFSLNNSSSSPSDLPPSEGS